MVERLARAGYGVVVAVGAALVIVALGACAGASLPDGTFPGGGYVPSGEERSAVVEYWVQCRGCEIEYTTPGGLERVEEDDALRKTVRFDGASSIRSVSLHVYPEEGEAVVGASISVNNRIVTEVRRSRNQTSVGEPVFLSASLEE